MPEPLPVLVIDLDGTLLAGNSFHVWAAYLLRGRFPHLGRAARVRVSAAGALALGRRRLGMTDHDAFRIRLQELWAQAIDGDGGASERAVQEVLVRDVRPALRPLLKRVAGDRLDSLLATAAPSEYALGLGARLGFRHVVATPPWGSGDLRATRGVRKREVVMARLIEAGWQGRPLEVLTDHPDDLPLIEASQGTWWFGDPAGEREVRAATPRTPLHGPTELPARWVMADESTG